ncbi:hypothetical protein G6F57_018032 [Rhizopus arrhizus]|nr:hypothetical protein G6F57_018032 [Rhizopus arrhizus]
MHLADGAKAQRVLQRALGVGLPQGAAVQQRQHVPSRPPLSVIRPLRLRRGQQGRQVSIQSFKRQGSHRISLVQQPGRVQRPQRGDGGAVGIGADDGQGVFAERAYGFQAGQFQRFCRRHAAALVIGFAFAHHRQPDLRQDGDVGLSDGAFAKHHGCNAAIQELGVLAQYFHLQAGAAEQRRIQPDEHGCPSHVLGGFGAIPGAVRMQQVPVELFRDLAHVGRDVAALEEGLILVQTHAAVQSVYGAVQLGVGQQQFEGALGTCGSVVGQHDAATQARDGADLLQGERAAVQRDRLAGRGCARWVP